jgi:hypothetical protein
VRFRTESSLATTFADEFSIQNPTLLTGLQSATVPFISKAQHLNSEVTLYPSSGAVVKPISFARDNRAKPAPFISKAQYLNSEVTLYPSSGAVVKSISFE